MRREPPSYKQTDTPLPSTTLCLSAELRRVATAAGPHQITDVVPDLYRAAVPYAPAARLLRAVVGIPEDASADLAGARLERSEEHPSELQSLLRISYAVFCLKKKNT